MRSSCCRTATSGADIFWTQGTTAAVTRKASLAFEGRSRLYIDCNNYANQLVFGSLTRLNRGVLAFFDNRPATLGVNEKILFDTPPNDPATFVGISMLLSVVALAACLIPARRATRLDPLVAVRRD